ncbi:hypothetical protein NIES4074_12950 [Cylindrospermum sp. NIES-4074]|nr:hypothetical protein NIES4074_12950 [Cylindrospermum sp. NIES-4074]
MSGTKAFALSQGISSTAFSGATASGGTILAGVTGVAIAAGIVVSLTGIALQAYQQRLERERKAKEQREAEIQQRIAQIRSGIGSSSAQRRITVQLPDLINPKVNNIGSEDANQAGARDAQRRVDELKNRLPTIRAEYQTLIEQELLDAKTVTQAIATTQSALNANDLAVAEAHLQALDDARIQVMQQWRSQISRQIQYLQERLDSLRPSIPNALLQEIQGRIDKAQVNWQQLSDSTIAELHQLLSTLEAQSQQIQEAAENMLASWLQVGYAARILGGDDGDVLLEVETHEGVNTQMRVQFNGQQIDLFGPPEETNSCASRTIEALKIFQQQGYQLQWTQWDGQAVPEELQYLYTAETEQESAPENTTSYTPTSSVRHQESQGY